VKRCLLGLHPIYQFLDPVEHSWIGDSGSHTLVMVDLAIDLDALLTHCFRPLSGGSDLATCQDKTTVGLIGSMHSRAVLFGVASICRMVARERNAFTATHGNDTP
jgi:hypothetical protein